MQNIKLDKCKYERLTAFCTNFSIDAATGFRKRPCSLTTAEPELAGSPNYPVGLPYRTEKAAFCALLPSVWRAASVTLGSPDTFAA
jgi:hypothetical protein